MSTLTLDEINEELRQLGCGDRNCAIALGRYGGQVTNGGCHCLQGVPWQTRLTVRQAVLLYRQKIELLTAQKAKEK